MSHTLPKAALNRGRSAFAMIDPETELYHHKRGRAQHVAISYVWTEWQNQSGTGLPDWPLLRSRLLELVGKSASSFMKVLTGHRVNCWLDSKCIDQNSSEDKAYWIPRMDDIYSEARCTVLLLRGFDLGPLVEAEQRLECHFDDDRHSCLLTQSCTATTVLPDDLSIKAVAVLKELYAGTWRKRAWIFQEILLSQEYIVSGENNTQVKLSDCGLLASLLFKQYSEQLWLGELAGWCRRLWYLRNRYHAYKLCVANVLQMAQGLEATVKADKYYALCGILRLKGINYNGAHSAEEALQSVICKLTEEGHLSWLYAIRPAILPQQTGALHLEDMNFSSYVDLDCQLGSFYAKPRLTPLSIGFSAETIGHIERVLPLSVVLKETREHVSRHGTNFPKNLQYMAAMPQILYKLANESMRPLLQQPLLGYLHQGLGLAKNASAADVVWPLYFLVEDEKAVASRRARPGMDISTVHIVASASWALRRQISSLRDAFSVVVWRRHEAGASKDKGKATGNYDCITSLGDANVSPTADIFRVCGDSIIFAAEPSIHGDGGLASWSGALLALSDSDLDRKFAPQISRLGSWLLGRGEPKSINLSFGIHRS